MATSALATTDLFPRDPQTFGGRLAVCRAARCLTQADLGRLLGEQLGKAISSWTISTWETDRHAPDAERLIAICRVLSVSADVLHGLRPFELPALPQ
jgi:transcriptional regulator with XRE-family HTH domain